MVVAGKRRPINIKFGIRALTGWLGATHVGELLKLVKSDGGASH